MTNPVRLLADPEVSADLQADLLALREHEIPFQLEPSLARFEARLDSGDLDTDIDLDATEAVEPSGVVPKGSADPSAAVGRGAAKLGAGKLSAGKLLGLLAVGAGVGFGALQFAGMDAPERDQVAPATRGADEATGPAAPEAAPDAASKANSVLDASAEEDLADAPASPRDEAPLPARPPARPPAVVAKEPAPPAPQVEVPEVEEIAEVPEEAPQEKASDALQRELAQLGEVRRALADDPRRALELANRGHAEFRKGALYQEREALALRALHALGARSALESRGQAFLLRYPKSSFAREVEGMLTR